MLIVTVILINPILVTGQNSKNKSRKANSALIEKVKYRNLFKEAGYSQKEIDKKLAKAYYDVFEGPNRVYFQEGDSLGYVSDVKNKDARTEGMSYGMMVAVQLDKKEVFDRIWRWSVKYMQHQSGPREGYFAWSVNPQTKKAKFARFCLRWRIVLYN